VTTDNSYHTNVVDNKDIDTVESMVSLKSNGSTFESSIGFLMVLPALLHVMHSIIKVVASDKAHSRYKKCSKHLGCYHLHMDLANDLISWGISMNWSDVVDDSRKPVYVRKQDYVPCGCMHCFFCKKALAHGVDHKKRGKHSLQSTRPECPIKREEVTLSPRYWWWSCTLCNINLQALTPS
jgi:hypothetical protein